ncbi:hypothetical protein J6P92_00370 [bacterium]|nr:hypothetical protein [bacterium]
MKVGLDLNRPKINNKPSFEGYKPAKNNYGDKVYEFNYVYDDENYDCYLELYRVKQDKNGNYIVTGEKDPYGNIKPLISNNALLEGSTKFGIRLEKGKATRINLAADYNIASDQPFAYHYVLRYKHDKNAAPIYKLDPGNKLIDAANSGRAHEVYNVVSGRASTVAKGGAMKLIVPDNYNVQWVYDDNNTIVKNPNIEKARKTNKNFANKIGGSLAGIEKDVEEGNLDNFTRIITTPLFADDSLSAHGYWNKNCYQMAQSLGNINNYASLQRKMFAKGMNLVSDGAYVNEGLEGVHFQHVLHWGKKSPYFNWFKISGLEDSPLSMGVFGKKTEHTTHRIVNSKYKFEEKDGIIKIKDNKQYNPKKPTYIQIYDDRLVDAKSLNDKELIRAYDKLPESALDINNHNDTVVPYHFEINPETYKHNVELLNAYNKSQSSEAKKIKLYSGEGTRAVTQFEYFGLDGKHESGFETWDANPDIAKLSFVPSHYETQMLKNIEDTDKRIKMKKLLARKHNETQDYAVSSAKYWTKKTNEILTLNIAQHLKGIHGKNAEEINKEIEKLSNGKVLPRDLDVNKTIVKNVLRGRYHLLGTDTSNIYDNAILQGLMNTPLDSIEVGDDIVSVLASPYMSKRAIKEDQIGVSRYDMYVDGNQHVTREYANTYNDTDKLYKKEMSALAKEILDKINDSLPQDSKLHDASGNTTPYGKYVIPLLTAEIARFAVIKGVAPKTEFKYNSANGEISYNYKEIKDTSLLGMGIIADSPEDEAQSLINKLKHNIKKIDKKDKEALTKALTLSIKDTSWESFALADMIVGRTQAGLDWRIDATKDIADIESLRNGKTDFEYTWNQVIKFWTKFAKGVKEYHPDAYMAAEVTDEEDIYDKGKGWNSGSRYSNKKEINKKLLNETGMTTTANYTYLSSAINQIFGKLFDYDGENSPDKGVVHGDTIYNQLVGGGNFFGAEPLESLLYSYTFAGNHDKCRALEGYAVDMDMVYVDLTDFNKADYRRRAYKILNAVPYGKEPTESAVKQYDFTRTSNLAIAKCESIASGMGKAINEIGVSQERVEYLYGMMLVSLSNLSKGIHKDKIFEADGFGTKDFDTALDIVLDEMYYMEKDYPNKKITADERKKLKDKSFEFILDPAMSKYLGHIKFLAALTGNPTLYAGDELGSTGYETTTKNIYLQNRNIVRNDWADPKSSTYKDFIKRNKDYVDYQFNLRARKELKALNDGTPFMLDLQDAEYSQPVYENNFFGKIKQENGHNVYKHGKTKLSALLKQSPDGNMTISVFNTEGLNHKFDEYYRPAHIKMKSINLNSDRGGFDKLITIGGLKSGTRFINANNKDDVYYVDNNNQLTGPDHKPVEFSDSVLVLYKDPNQNPNPSFTGRRIMYNPQYNIVSNPYVNKKEVVEGSKLQLISK